MKCIKSIIIVTIFFSLASNLVTAQVKIKWEDVKVINDQTIVVKVFAQNYGRGFEFYNGYGYYGNKKEANFFVEYDLLRENRRIKVLPNSITIKTIFGSSIEMDTPTYYFNSTGTENGQYWEIIFNLPYESANIAITVMGRIKSIDDFEQGKELKQKLNAEFLSNKDTKTFDYKNINSKEYTRLEEKIKQIVFKYAENQGKGIISGTISLRTNKQGEVGFESSINNSELTNLIKNSLNKDNLKRAEKNGYLVNAIANFDVLIAKGKTKVEIDKDNKIVRAKPNISNNTLLEAIQNDISTNGNFKVKYDIVSVNSIWYPYSDVNSKLVKFNYAYLFWGVPVVIGAILVVTSGDSD